ncbi:MAPEG family protein [Roseibium aggregatum]|uniref:MAPEG family protein n=1 Tax=Roseibium aggregatum TaxID=187304 RepID=A0A926S6G4_9HYPH|nr:MAPEG family protein [Roseibium aggregatum]MBD1547521.1 MAPEG family protein [Roseibium aggregatum]
MLSDKQKGVARGLGGAIAATLVAYGLALWLAGDAFAAFDTLLGRMRLLALSVLPLLAFFCISIGSLARHRFFSADDIDGSGLTTGTATAHQLQAVLQNTLEQTVLAAIAYLAYALLAPASWLILLPAGAGLFLIGRILFWQGYGSGAPGRAFGFALTFYSTIFIALPAIVFAFLQTAP